MAKKILKLFVAGLASMGIAFAPLTLAACNTTKDDEKDPGHNIVTPNPDPTPGDTPEIKDPEDDKNKTPEEKPDPVEDDSKYETTKVSKTDINAVYKLIRDEKNYSFDVTSASGKVGGSIERDGDKLYFTDIYSGKNYYATNNGENDLKISYDTSESKWMATVVDSSDEAELTLDNVDLQLRKIVSSPSFKTYNTKTGEYKGFWTDYANVRQEVSVFINKEDDKIVSFVMNVKDETNPYTYEISKFGTTSLTLPSYTLDGVEIDSSENVLTVENGKYNFNYKLVKPIVENWLKGENSYGMDLVDKAIATRNCETEQVLFMNLSKDNIELYISYKDKDSSERFLRQYNIVDRELYETLKTVNSVTENELTDYLKNTSGGVSSSIDSKMYNVDYISTDADFASHKDQFNALTSKVFERAQTVGVQGYSIENNGTTVDYSGYNIVSAFKTVPTSPNSLDFKCEGLNQSFNMVYLTEKDGNYDLLDILVVSSVERGLSNIYTNITDNDASTATNWMVSKSTTTSMNSENAKLYDYSAKTTYSTNYNARDVIVDDKDHTL
ncbi:MAG: hypothetical protein K2K31_02795 [Clostridia bacterium]|nr:hypothetical protein [Clostridia bacterium]